PIHPLRLQNDVSSALIEHGSPGYDVQNPVRFYVKNKFSLALVALIIFSFALPVFVFAQQAGQTGTSAGRPRQSEPQVTGTRRRDLRRNTTGPLADDFQEALKVIEQKYVDGNKLDYNNVYKSSIMGMLRTLDPHSSYFDREEFDELKTD